MKRLSFLFALALPVVALAQQPAQTPGVSPALIKVFGDIKAFSSKAEIRLVENGQTVMTMPVTMALLDGKMRTESDMAEAKGTKAPAEAMAMLKGSGLEKVVTIMQPDRKATVFIYPGLQAYTEITVPDQEAADPKFDSVELGKETIDTHPCTKTKLVSTDSQGVKQEIIVWKATGLKNFPIQVQTAERGSTVIVRYQSPKIEKPDASLFTPPASYKKYAGVETLMQAAMMKILGGQK